MRQNKGKLQARHLQFFITPFHLYHPVLDFLQNPIFSLYGLKCRVTIATLAAGKCVMKKCGGGDCDPRPKASENQMGSW